MERKFIDLKELAEMIHISIPTLNKWVADGKIPSYKVGKRRLFRKEEILEWMENHKDVDQKSL